MGALDRQDEPRDAKERKASFHNATLYSEDVREQALNAKLSNFRCGIGFPADSPSAERRYHRFGVGR
jgi:hypothetical protein